MLGSLVDQSDLTQRFTVLLRHLVPYLPDSEYVTLAAAIDPADSVMLGDPDSVGNRTSGHVGFGQGEPVTAPPVDQMSTTSLGSHLYEAASDLAARIAQALRGLR
jgi:hypothetical protein